MIYLYIAIKSKGTVQKKVALIFIGILLIYLADWMDSEIFIGSVTIIPLEVPPIIMIAGIIIFNLQFYYFPYFYIKNIENIENIENS